MSTVVLEDIKQLASNLTPEDKLRLIGELSRQLLTQTATQEAEPPSSDTSRKPYRSLCEALKHRGPAPSAEDIDEARREAWANFPRESFYE